MKLPEICIRHPVFTLVLNILLILIGLISLHKLSIRYFPDFQKHTVSVYTEIPGASAVYMYNQVTKVLENSLAGVDGISKYTSSNHDNGKSSIKIEIKSDTNYYAAVETIRNKVTGAQKYLPEMPTPPSVSDESGANYNAVPTLNFVFFSKSSSLQQLDEYITTIVIPRIQNIPGVGGTPRYGQPTKTLWIWLNPAKMAQLKVTASDINSAIINNNISINSGSIISIDKKFALVSDTKLKTPEQFGKIVIRYEKNQPILLEDVVNIEWGPRNIMPQNVYINGKQGIAMEIRPFKSANPVTVAKKVLLEIENIKKKLPSDIKIKNTYNQTIFIKNAINECIKSCIEAIILVALIIFIFLGSFRSSLIPIVTIPVCIIATFAIMTMFNFSLNVISLLAIVLAIGLVVDDAIVIVENTHRHISKGNNPLIAAIISSNELIFPIIAMTLTLVAVYIPIGMSTGFTVTVFREFAFTLAGAVFISGFVALTLSPMMCAYLLKPNTKSLNFSNKIEDFITNIVKIYSGMLQVFIERKMIILLVLITCPLIGFIVFKNIGKELIPKEDIGYLEAKVKLPPAVNQNYINKNMDLLDEQLGKNQFDYVMSFHTSRPTSFITLKPWEKRKFSAQTIIKNLSNKINTEIPTFNLAFKLPDPVDYGIGSTGFILNLTTLDQNIKPKNLKILSDKVVNILSEYPYLSNVHSSLVYDTPQIKFNIKRDLMAKFGVNIKDIQDSLNLMMGVAPRITQIKVKNGNSYDVRAQLNKSYLTNFNLLSDIYVKANTGDMISMVPLSELIVMHQTTNSSSINTYQRQRSATIAATILPQSSLSKIEKDVTKLISPLLKDTQNMYFEGSIKNMKESQSSSTFLILLALIFIYLILAAQFGSFIDPFVIMITVPLTIVGALLTLYLFKGTLNVYSNIGFVTLIGLITKHGILIVQFANSLIEKGHGLKEAIIKSAETRLRPILMTTFAMILGVFPLAIATGAGSVGRFNIGIVITSGLFFGTIFSLFVVPLAYLILSTHKSKDITRINTSEKT